MAEKKGVDLLVVYAHYQLLVVQLMVVTQGITTMDQVSFLLRPKARPRPM